MDACKIEEARDTQSCIYQVNEALFHILGAWHAPSSLEMAHSDRGDTRLVPWAFEGIAGSFLVQVG